MTRCSVRYVHKIAPSDKDVGPDVEIPDGAFAGPKELGKALRDAGVLLAGARIVSFKVEGNRVTAFPIAPGLTTYWHSIILQVLP